MTPPTRTASSMKLLKAAATGSTASRASSSFSPRVKACNWRSEGAVLPATRVVQPRRIVLNLRRPRSDELPLWDTSLVSLSVEAIYRLIITLANAWVSPPADPVEPSDTGEPFLFHHASASLRVQVPADSQLASDSSRLDAFGGRCSGSLARHCMMSCSRSEQIALPSRSDGFGGIVFNWCINTSRRFLSSNNGLPVSKKYPIAPTAYKSLRASSSSGRSTPSGAR